MSRIGAGGEGTVIIFQFLFQGCVFLGEAIIQRNIGFDLPGSGDPGLFPLENHLLFLSVMDDRTGNLGHGTILILHKGHRKVLHFCVVMGYVREKSLHIPGPPHHPAQHIDVVNGMVQGAAATLLFPKAPPPKVVVAVPSPPKGIHLCVENPADFTAFQDFLYVPDRIPKPVLSDYGEKLPAFIPGFDHFITFLQGSGHGFFYKHVFAMLQKIYCNFPMAVGRGADAHQVDVVPVQKQFVRIGNGNFQAVFFGFLLCFFWENIAKSCNFTPLRKLKICPDVSGRNIACSDNGYPNHMKSSFFCIRDCRNFAVCAQYTTG